MATEPRQVEVVCECPSSPLIGTNLRVMRPKPDGWSRATLKPDSLTARMLDLAEAAMHPDIARLLPVERGEDGDEAFYRFTAALAALRAHPDYVRPA